MAVSSYSELRARWMDALATDDTDTEFAARLPGVISDAEQRCYRELDPVATRRIAQAQPYTPGSPTVTLLAECWIPRRLVLVEGTTRTTLLQRQHTFLDEYWPNPALLGTPKYWAMPEDGTVQLVPTPLVAPVFSLLLDYTFQPATMTLANPTTWLTEHYADLLYYAGMIVLSGWKQNDAAVVQWTARYQEALGTARFEEARKKGEPPMEVGPSQPIPAPGG